MFDDTAEGVDVSKNIAIIPARAGSKRISKKNIRFFAGKPIIAYSIEAALKTGLFSEVIVSTDSEEIAAIARDYGAATPFLRSDVNASDYATMSDVLLEVLNWYSDHDIHYENLCCLLATAPLISVENILEGYRKITESDSLSAISIQEFSFPILRSLKLDENDCLKINWPEHHPKRSQDLRSNYHDAGQFYWSTVSEYKKNKRFLNSKTSYILLNDFEAHDIDTENDWQVAEFKYAYRQRKMNEK